jgi:hypothetical protein
MTGPTRSAHPLPRERAPAIDGSHAPLATLRGIVVRVLVTLLVIVTLHWTDRLAPWYFVLGGAGAGAMLLSSFVVIPGLRFLSALSLHDRLSIWIILVASTVVGYVHNANDWLPDGHLFRPVHVPLWKTELILGISLGAPLAHWLAGRLMPWLASTSGRRFAAEFALYVNFSGIALVLWTGPAAVSVNMLGAAIVLVLLAELTLYATQ